MQITYNPVVAPEQDPDRAETEAEFFARYDASDYPRPSLTVDVVVLSVIDGALAVLVYQRSRHPQKHRFALPGGFVELHESLERAAERVLADKAGLSGVYLDQFHTFGDVDRDPRGRVVSVGYYALVAPKRLTTLPVGNGGVFSLRPDAQASAVRLLDRDGDELPLFLDHGRIIHAALDRLREQLDTTPVGFQLLGARFTLRELQVVHQAIRGEKLNKDSFRRRMLESGLLVATGEHEEGKSYRPAEYYRFSRKSAV